MKCNAKFVDQFDKVKNDLQHYKNVGDAGYYRLISEILQHLQLQHNEEDSIARYLLERINRLDEADGESSLEINIYEYDVLQMLNVSLLEKSTLVLIYKKLFERMYTVVTFTMLCYLRKIFRYIVLKDEQATILRRLQSLISPLDKRCVKIVIGTINDIIVKWNTDDENRKLFQDLLEVPKWGKLEFYVCKAVFKHVDTLESFKAVIGRIFSGFCENHTAHSAYVLFQSIFEQDKMEYFDSLLDDVCEVLNRPQAEYNKTTNSSLITYVIPVMCDLFQVDFLLHCQKFSPLYRLHTLRHCYVNNFIDEIEPDVFIHIIKHNTENHALVQLVWEMVCLFPSYSKVVGPQHLNLFITLLHNYYRENIPNVRDLILAFLSQVVISWIVKDKPMYQVFFIKIRDILTMFMDCNDILENNIHVIQAYFETYILSLNLLHHDYTLLKTKYAIPENFQYNCDTNPMCVLRDIMELDGLDLIRFAMDININHEILCSLVYHCPLDFTRSGMKYIQHSILVACTSPNFDNIQKVCTYTNLLANLYIKDDDEGGNLTVLQDELQFIFRDQYLSISALCNKGAILANPIYITAEALYTVVRACLCPTSFYEALVDTADTLIKFVLDNREHLFDSYTKKSIEYIFVGVLKLMYVCVEALSFAKTHSDRLFHRCQSVILESQLRRASSSAYTLLFALMNSTSYPLYSSFYTTLMSTLDHHLEAIENKAFNRWTGNREMILLSFKLLKEDRKVFNDLLWKLVNSSMNHDENHLRALEAVLKESCLKEVTSPFVIPILEKALENLTNTEYCHRNAAGCLIQIIANRILGMKSEIGERPLSMHQAFERSPDLLKICKKAFDLNTNSKYGVLCLLAEAPYYPSIFGESYELSPTAFDQLITDDEEDSSLCAVAALACANSLNGKFLHSTIDENLRQYLRTGAVTNMQLLTLKHLVTRYFNNPPWSCTNTDLVNIAFKYGSLLNMLGPGDEYDELRYEFSLLNAKFLHLFDEQNEEIEDSSDDESDDEDLYYDFIGEISDDFGCSGGIAEQEEEIVVRQLEDDNSSNKLAVKSELPRRRSARSLVF